MLFRSVIGSALYVFGIKYYMADNIARYGSEIDGISRSSENFHHTMSHFFTNMEMISVKQIYGLVIYVAIALFILILLYDMPYTRSTIKRMPSWHSIGKAIRRKVKPKTIS